MPSLPQPKVEPRDIEALTFQYARTRDTKTREVLVLHYQKLVYYLAGRFVSKGEMLEDLIQVGNIGLINALDRFDPSKDVKFSTYAVPNIVGEIKRHFRDKTWHVKVPRWLQDLSVSARKAQQTLAARLGRSPTLREVAAELNVSEETALEAVEVGRVATALSLDARSEGGASDGSALSEQVGRLDPALYAVEVYTDLQRALETLNPREQAVVRLRFFEDLSQLQIAERLEISQMHVSRLQQRALVRLRSLLAEETGRAPRRPPCRPAQAASSAPLSYRGAESAVLAHD